MSGLILIALIGLGSPVFIVILYNKYDGKSSGAAPLKQHNTCYGNVPYRIGKNAHQSITPPRRQNNQASGIPLKSGHSRGSGYYFGTIFRSGKDTSLQQPLQQARKSITTITACYDLL
jgi:hypothetical protein